MSEATVSPGGRDDTVRSGYRSTPVGAGPAVGRRAAKSKSEGYCGESEVQKGGNCEEGGSKRENCLTGLLRDRGGVLGMRDE
jgi:hypothetical protein